MGGGGGGGGGINITPELTLSRSPVMISGYVNPLRKSYLMEALGFSTVTPPPPPQRFPFRCDNMKNILDLSNLVYGYIWAMPRTLLFCDLDLQFFKVTGGLLKVRFWPFFHILAQFSYTES